MSPKAGGSELCLVEDKSAKTKSYFCRGGQVVIGRDVIERLKEEMRREDLPTIRICLHRKISDPVHEMVILQRRGAAFPAHRHPTKEESYHVIEGRMTIEFLSDEGKIETVLTLGDPASGLPFLARIRENTWHRTFPESDVVVFHESRPGPFEGTDSQPAPWGT